MPSPYAFEPDMDDTAQGVFGVTRDGLSQLRRYWRAAEPRAVVLVVHGIAEHSHRYEHVARQLNASGLSVVAYDQRGHGESGGRRGHVDSMEQFHDDLEDQLATARDTGLPVIMLGHSMGGLVCASYGLTDRPQADLMVLSAPALSVEAKRSAQAPLLALARLTSRPTMKLPFSPSQLSSDPRVGEAYEADPLVFRHATLGLLAALVDTSRWVASSLPAWQHQTLIIHGLEDQLVPPRASEPLGRREDVERRTYPTGRHELLNEPWGPDVVDDVVAWVDARL